MVEVAAAAVKGGVEAVQVREQDLSAAELLALVRELKEVTAGRAALLVNDRVDVALAVGTEGVHLPGRGLPVGEARRILGGGAVIGRSVHSVREALAAEEEGADYVIFGPVFETPFKLTFGPPQGVTTLRELTAAVQIPVLAIGGMDPERAGEMKAAGAGGIAVLSFLLEHPAPAEGAARLMAAWEGKTWERK